MGNPEKDHNFANLPYIPARGASRKLVEDRRVSLGRGGGSVGTEASRPGSAMGSATIILNSL